MVDFVVDFAMVNVVTKGVEEWFISQQPGNQSLFCFFEMVTGFKEEYIENRVYRNT